MEEATLIEKARRGDEAALALLAESCAPRLLRFGQKLCGSTVDAEDVMQQTLLSVVDHIGEFRGDSDFSSWLFAIARSHCIKLRTRGGAGRTGESLEQIAKLAAPGAGADEATGHEQQGRALELAIQSLEPTQREVLVLRDVEGLSAAQVATALGLSVDAVKSRLHRARKSLREQLTPWLEQSAPTAACPDVVDLLSRYQEGDITSEACQTLQAHVETCAHCARRCYSLRSILTACNATPLPALSPELKLAVREQIRRSLKRQTG